MANYTQQQVTFVEIFLEESAKTGEYRKAGAKAKLEAGYSDKMSINKIMGECKDLLIEQVGIELAQKIPKLLFKLEEVVDNPNLPGAKRIIDACATLLDRAGIVKREESTVHIKTPDGVLILPPKNKEN